MKAPVAILALAGLGMAAPAEAERTFHPMEQFEVRPLRLAPSTGRSASTYARCAGAFANAYRRHNANSYARDLDARLMAKAFAIGGPDAAEQLASPRADEARVFQQFEQRVEALERTAYHRDATGQLVVDEAKQKEVVSLRIEQLVRMAPCQALAAEFDGLGDEVEAPRK